MKLGEPSPLFKVGAEARAALHSTVGFDVSADGQRLLVPKASPELSEIVVIQNWEPAARRTNGQN